MVGSRGCGSPETRGSSSDSYWRVPESPLRRGWCDGDREEGARAAWCAGDGGEGRCVDVRQEGARPAGSREGVCLYRASHRRWAPGRLQLGVEELAPAFGELLEFVLLPTEVLLA